MNQKHRIFTRLFLSLLCFLTAFLLQAAEAIRTEEAMAERISPELLRFHILADSDRPQDQRLKLQVRDRILTFISDFGPKEPSKEELSRWLTDNRDLICTEARRCLAENGSEDPVSLSLTREYFPQKSYEEFTFPGGVYDALRVTIGEGRGHNWWCVLYPSLCISDTLGVSVPDTSRELLQQQLSPEDYQALIQKRPRIRIRLRILDLPFL